MEFMEGYEKICYLRKKLKMKQQDFVYAGISKGYFGLLENGKRKITRETEKKIIKVFKEKLKILNLDESIILEEGYFTKSKKEEANDYCNNLLKGKPSFEDMNKIIEICDEYNLIKLKYQCNIKKATYLQEHENYNEAYICYIKCLDLIDKNDFIKKMKIYGDLGYCKYLNRYYEEAVVYYNMIMNRLKSVDNEVKIDKNINRSLYLGSICCCKVKKYDLVLEMIDLCIENINENTDVTDYAYAICLKAKCFRLKGDINKAIDIYNNFLKKINACIEKDNCIVAHVYDGLGMAYLQIDELDKAENLFNMCLKLRQYDDVEKMCHALINKGYLFIKKEMYDEAELIIKLGIEQAIKYKDYNNVIIGYEYLDIIYNKINEPLRMKKVLLKIVKNLEQVLNGKELIEKYSKLQSLYFDDEEYMGAYYCQRKMEELLNRN